MTRTLILGGPAQLASRVNVLPGTQVVALPTETVLGDRFNLVRSLDPQSLPDLILFGEDLPVEVTLRIAQSACESYPSIHLVQVGDLRAEVVLEAMRAGIRDVVPPDAPEPKLVEVLRRAEQQRVATEVSVPTLPPPPPNSPEISRIVTVISPKGGVGKTSIASNLAIGLAEEHPMDVVLVDLDLQFGDVSSVLDMRPQSTMEDALGPTAAADTLVLKTLLTVHPSGFHVLCGAESPAANEHVTGAQVKRLLEQLVSQFAWVVVDTAAGLDEPTLAALEVTDDAVLVSTMDVSCVRGVRKEIGLLNELGLLPTSRSLVLNMADKQSGLKVKDVEAVVGLPVNAVIARAPEVQLAANHGQPLMLKGRKKGGPFVKSIWSVVERLVHDVVPSGKHRRQEVA